MHILGETVSSGGGIFLFLAVALALAFECVNGFHDTANAVATVIYTHTLKPWMAVVWSGLWNFVGVLTSRGAVAYGIVALLPVELVLNVGSAAEYAMIFSLLIAAILWNAGTWYMGLPASSTHSLIGAIVGVGLAHSVMTPGLHFGQGQLAQVGRNGAGVAHLASNWLCLRGGAATARQTLRQAA